MIRKHYKQNRSLRLKALIVKENRRGRDKIARFEARLKRVVADRKIRALNEYHAGDPLSGEGAL